MSEENQNQPNTDYRAEHMVGMPKSGMPWKKHSKKYSISLKIIGIVAESSISIPLLGKKSKRLKVRRKN